MATRNGRAEIKKCNVEEANRASIALQNLEVRAHTDVAKEGKAIDRAISRRLGLQSIYDAGHESHRASAVRKKRNARRRSSNKPSPLRIDIARDGTLSSDRKINRIRGEATTARCASREDVARARRLVFGASPKEVKSKVETKLAVAHQHQRYMGNADTSYRMAAVEMERFTAWSDLSCVGHGAASTPRAPPTTTT